MSFNTNKRLKMVRIKCQDCGREVDTDREEKVWEKARCNECGAVGEFVLKGSEDDTYDEDEDDEYEEEDEPEEEEIEDESEENLSRELEEIEIPQEEIPKQEGEPIIKKVF